MSIKPIIATIVAVFATAIPAGGDELQCVTVEVGHDAEGVVVESEDWTEGAPRSALVGHYVWFDWSGVDGGSSGEADTLSFDISDPDIVSATACNDGSVELTRVQSEPVGGDSAPDETPPSESPLTPVCELHADVLEHYCTLPNRTLVVS